MPGNVADAILQLLADSGVERLYGVTGDAVFPLLDAVARQEKISYIAAAHEAGAAFMASAEAQITGAPGVCLATSGPGAVNLANGLAAAYFDHTPVLAITGQVPTDKIGTNVKQYFHQGELIKTFASYSEPLLNPQALVPLLQSAMATAVNQQTVAHLSIPRNVLLMPAVVPEAAVITGKSSILGSGFAEDMALALNLCKNWRRPLLVLGVRDRETVKMCCTLAKILGAGIIIAQQAKGAVAEKDELIIGGIGEAYLPALLSQTDGILLVGEAPYEMSFLPREAPKIQVSGQSRGPEYGLISCALIGNPAVIVKGLAQRMSSVRHSEVWTEEIKKEKQLRSQTLRADSELNDSPVHPARLTAALNRTLAADAVITMDIGSFIHWFDRGFQAKQQQVLISGNWRSMGSGLPAAIAAKLACPDKQVVAVTGDGGFLMCLGELVTAVYYNVPVTVVVFNNHGYSLEKQKMQAQGLQAYGYQLAAPDFAAYARACGAMGYQVRSPQRLENVISEALSCGLPAVVDVEVAEVSLPYLQTE